MTASLVNASLLTLRIVSTLQVSGSAFALTIKDLLVSLQPDNGQARVADGRCSQGIGEAAYARQVLRCHDTARLLDRQGRVRAARLRV